MNRFVAVEYLYSKKLYLLKKIGNSKPYKMFYIRRFYNEIVKENLVELKKNKRVFKVANCDLKIYMKAIYAPTGITST
jgi:hypothetical protein